MGAFPPQSKDLSPYLPPSPDRREKMAKISHFQQIFGYLPPQNAFCSLDAPTKEKKLVLPLFTVYIFITFDHDVGYLEWFTLHPQAIKISCFSFTCYIWLDHSGLKIRKCVNVFSSNFCNKLPKFSLKITDLNNLYHTVKITWSNSYKLLITDIISTKISQMMSYMTIL